MCQPPLQNNIRVNINKKVQLKPKPKEPGSDKDFTVGPEKHSSQVPDELEKRIGKLPPFFRFKNVNSLIIEYMTSIIFFSVYRTLILKL